MPQSNITQIARTISGNYFGIYPSGYVKLKNNSKIIFDYDSGVISGKDIIFPENVKFYDSIDVSGYVNLSSDINTDNRNKNIVIGDQIINNPGHFETIFQDKLYGQKIQWDSDYAFFGLYDSGVDKKRTIIGFGDNYGSDALDFVFFDYDNSILRNLFSITTGGLYIYQDSNSPLSPSTIGYSNYLNSYCVHISGDNQSINGIKTFTSSPIIPYGDSTYEAVAFGQLTATGNYILSRAILDSDFSSNGIMVRLSDGNYTSRTITNDSTISVSYGNGVSSNPVIGLSSTYKNLVDNSVQVIGDQSIDGTKYFLDPIQLSGRLDVLSNIDTNNKYKGVVLGDQTSHVPGNFETLFSTKLFGVKFQWDSDYMFVGLNNSGTDKKRATIGFGDNYGTDTLDFVFFDYNTARVRNLFSITTGGIFIGNGQEVVSKYYIDVLFEESIHHSDFSSNGLMTRTANGNYTSRTITNGSGITVTNGDGVSASPSISIDSSSYSKINTAILDSDIVSNGIIVRTSNGSYLSRSISAGNGISINYGDGVLNNPYIYIDAYNYSLIHNSIQNSGNQSINGIKTFTSSPIIPYGGSVGEAINYDQFIESGNYIYSIIGENSSSILAYISTLSGSIISTGEYLNDKIEETDNNLVETGKYLFNILDSGIYSIFDGSGIEIGSTGSLFFKNDSGYFSPINISEISGDVFISDGKNPRWASLENEINVLGVKVNNISVLTERQPAIPLSYTDLNEYQYSATVQNYINAELKDAINQIRIQLSNLSQEVRSIRYGLTNKHHLFEPSYSDMIYYSGDIIYYSGEPITITY